MSRFVVTCGGTGGHAFPGLAVAEELRRRGHDVEVWDSGRLVESSVMKTWHGAVYSTGAKPLSPRNIFSNLFCFIGCLRRIGKFKPDAILAMGSYSSLPPVAAAVMRRVPVILHEANTVPGRAVDFLSRFAAVTAISFPVTAEYLPERKTVLTGLPVRADIHTGTRFEDFPADAFTVFVTGGSQGAHRLNEIAAQALVLVARELERRGPNAVKLRIIHQSGFADEGDVMGRYAAAGINARVQPFEQEMARAFATANLVVCRAGASTCFELARCGKPAFLVPYPSALRNHQHFNAASFAAAGAADEGEQDSLTPRALANWILHKIDHPGALAMMAEKMAALGEPAAAAKTADLVEKYASAGTSSGKGK